MYRSGSDKNSGIQKLFGSAPWAAILVGITFLTPTYSTGLTCEKTLRAGVQVGPRGLWGSIPRSDYSWDQYTLIARNVDGDVFQAALIDRSLSPGPTLGWDNLLAIQELHQNRKRSPYYGRVVADIELMANPEEGTLSLNSIGRNGAGPIWVPAGDMKGLKGEMLPTATLLLLRAMKEVFKVYPKRDFRTFIISSVTNFETLVELQTQCTVWLEQHPQKKVIPKADLSKIVEHLGFTKFAESSLQIAGIRTGEVTGSSGLSYPPKERHDLKKDMDSHFSRRPHLFTEAYKEAIYRRLSEVGLYDQFRANHLFVNSWFSIYIDLPIP